MTATVALLACILILLFVVAVMLTALFIEVCHLRASLDALAEMLGEAIDTWREG